ncbi:Uncharacterised protein [Bordetella pertussis]|nr:Uncharacterised protein [Bordetella pertussis]
MPVRRKSRKRTRHAMGRPARIAEPGKAAITSKGPRWCSTRCWARWMKNMRSA